MDCSHKKSSKKRVKKEIVEETFIAQTQVCDQCGAFLHDDEYEIKYMRWISKLYGQKRSKFQTQHHFSKNLVKCAEEYLKRYPTIPISVFMRALVIVYFEIIDKDVRKSSQLEQMQDETVLNSFLKDKNKIKVNIQFKPQFMIELIDIAELINQTPSALVGDIIIKLMTIITSEDQKLRQFWENEIRMYLDMFLKVA